MLWFFIFMDRNTPDMDSFQWQQTDTFIPLGKMKIPYKILSVNVLTSDLKVAHTPQISLKENYPVRNGTKAGTQQTQARMPSMLAWVIVSTCGDLKWVFDEGYSSMLGSIWESSKLKANYCRLCLHGFLSNANVSQSCRLESFRWSWYFTSDYMLPHCSTVSQIQHSARTDVHIIYYFSDSVIALLTLKTISCWLNFPKKKERVFEGEFLSDLYKW